MRRVWDRSARWFLVAVLAIAATGKLLDPHPVRWTPTLLPSAGSGLRRLSSAFEGALPALELTVVASLALGIGPRAGGALALLLSTAFLWAALALPPGARCGCFGAFGGPSGRAWHAVLAGLSLLAAARLLVSNDGRR